MKKEKISLTIDAELWKEAKIHCVKNDVEYSSFVEQLIRERLKKPKQ